MKWTILLDLDHDSDCLTSATKKAGAAIQKRIYALLVEQKKLDGLETALREAPLTEIQDWGQVGRRYVELLTEELKIRQDIAPWLQQAAKDRSKAADKAFQSWEKSKQDVKDGLLKMGYTEESLLGCDIIARHPTVKGWRLEQQALRDQGSDHSHLEANQGAIQWLESELKRRRERMLV